MEVLHLFYMLVSATWVIFSLKEFDLSQKMTVEW